MKSDCTCILELDLHEGDEAILGQSIGWRIFGNSGMVIYNESRIEGPGKQEFIVSLSIFLYIRMTTPIWQWEPAI